MSLGEPQYVPTFGNNTSSGIIYERAMTTLLYNNTYSGGYHGVAQIF